MRCSKCGAELQEGVAFCRECGCKVELKKRFCRECGAEVAEGSKFCSNCGAAFEIQTNDKTAEQTTTTQRAVLTDEATFGDKSKDKVIAWWNGLDLFCKIATIMMGFAILLLLIAMISNKAFPIVISILQIGGAVAALLMHKKVIKLEQGWIKYLVLAAVALFMVLNFMSYSWGNDSDSQATNEISTADGNETSDNVETTSSTESGNAASRVSKNGFDSSTNEIYKFASYTMEIPNYWIAEKTISDGIQRYAETGGKVAMLQVSASKETDSDYEVTFDGLMADNANMMLTLRFTAFKKITDYEVIDTGNVKGILYTGIIEYEGYTGTGQWFEFASEEDRNWCSVAMSQTDNTEYNYDEDFEKMIYSIKKKGQEENVPDVEMESDEIVSEVADLIAVPDDSTAYYGQNYKDVKTLLQEAGFTKVISTGVHTEDSAYANGSVADILIDGTSFSKGDVFESDEVITIKYWKVETLVSEYEKAFVRSFEEYSLYIMFDSDNSTVIDFVTNDGYILEGTYSGNFDDGVDIKWIDHEDSWHETLIQKDGSTKATLIDSNGFDWEYQECDLATAQKALDKLK